jgi:hypothetical protein
MRCLSIQLMCALLAITAIAFNKDPSAFIAAIAVIGALHKENT